MNIKQRSNSGFTRVELLVVVITTILIFILGINNIYGSDRKKRVSYCKYNLIQIYRALNAFSIDSDGKFPWGVPEKDGGSAEYVPSNQYKYAYKHWHSLSKYLEHPKVLACLNDNRTVANSWLEKKPQGDAGKGIVPFSNSMAFSYFIGTESFPNEPEYIISGDRNISFGNYNNDNDRRGSVVKFGKKFTTKKTPYWTGSLHNNSGMLLKGDGSASFVGSLRLGRELIFSKSKDNQFHMPRGK